MPRDYDNRNRSKSWREIDKAREGGAKREREREGAAFEDRARRNTGAYNTYKKDLENLFSGAAVPEYLKEIAPVGDEARLTLLGKIQRSVTPEELAQAMRAYLAKYEDFPEDYALLLRVLEYEDEVIQLVALRMLDGMSRVRPLEHKQQFILKLDALAMMADDDDLRELAEELVARWR